ncbi:MAG: phosphodiesterase [Clostridia bacterium]|nr:phosphodiesterase [Clostridia bacterium]
MKLFVVSDIHGSKYYAEKIKEIYHREKPDKIILLGDLYYHGPRNPLTKEYNPMEVSQILNSLKDNILCVRGNCDAEVDEMISDFHFEDSIRLDIGGKKFFFTHGHKYNMDNIPADVDVLIYGHFHTGFIKEKDGVLCINAGSITLPKENTPNSYLIINDSEIILMDIDNHVIDKVNYL